jgi:hypothetical protein
MESVLEDKICGLQNSIHNLTINIQQVEQIIVFVDICNSFDLIDLDMFFN